MQISRILHAGYIFEHGGKSIAFDPIFENPFSRNCHAFPSVAFDLDKIRELKLEAVFISHFHDDHCSLESLNLLARDTPIYLYCLFEEMFEWIRQLGFEHVHSLKLDQRVTIGDFKITPRRALDADVDSIFQIEAGGVQVLNVVDSWIDDSTLARLVTAGPWDMVLWPFQTMRELEVLAPSRATHEEPEFPIEWKTQLQALNPRIVVPSSCQFQQESWSWYNQKFFPMTYRQFQNEVEVILPQAQVMRMNPSVSVRLTPKSCTRAAALDWITPLGEQNVDYDFSKNAEIPTSAEIAKRFSPLNAAEMKLVVEYCQLGILEKHASLREPQDSYFQKPRLWRLSLYDSAGEAQHFFYRVRGASLELAQEGDAPVAWSTEVPAAKLYAALEHGESLTSMYMRINGVVFDAAIEHEIQDADILDDPLVRCLFHGTFGAYQKAQLERLTRGVAGGGPRGT